MSETPVQDLSPIDRLTKMLDVLVCSAPDGGDKSSAVLESAFKAFESFVTDNEQSEYWGDAVKGVEVIVQKAESPVMRQVAIGWMAAVSKRADVDALIKLYKAEAEREDRVDAVLVGCLTVLILKARGNKYAPSDFYLDALESEKEENLTRLHEALMDGLEVALSYELGKSPVPAGIEDSQRKLASLRDSSLCQHSLRYKTRVEVMETKLAILVPQSAPQPAREAAIQHIARSLKPELAS